MNPALRREGLYAALEWGVARTIFPVLLGGCVLWAMVEIDAGAAPARAIVLPTLLAYFVLGLMERVLFWQPSWLHSQGDLKVDVGHLVGRRARYYSSNRICKSSNSTR